MNKDEILGLLNSVANGTTTPEAAMAKLKRQPFEDLGYAKIDHHRDIRQGVPEVIFGQTKSAQQILNIVERMRTNGTANILITRLSEASAQALSTIPDFSYDATAKIAVVGRTSCEHGVGEIVVASGGTSDLPVCEEAAITAEVLGNHVTRLYDVGVSGLHRLLAHLDTLSNARVVIVVAGMEGALASVVGGLVDCPVIAVPTSVGYGASFHGLAALLSMLNSCASGVSVVNIDNGFGAGYLASRINKMEGIK